MFDEPVPIPIPQPPPVRFPEDIRAREEMLAAAPCPVCKSEGTLLRGATVGVGTQYGSDVPRPVQSRICSVCGYIALFLF